MADHMNKEQYRKACRYRMQETVEGLAGVWKVDDEEVDEEMIGESLDWLERTVEELKYFREKITTTEDGPPKPGALP